ncbi:hypothetical protein [Paenibacillus sp.]|uniref:hypothetical protein n=1 Tax=Paenibacillus sp. TaxID=58172 RepID=UPI002D65344C|nr:hypothetical protein [Paenibacillus sp.]HZG86638.1 hypothetical protein [Paenibacillus sp.]
METGLAVGLAVLFAAIALLDVPALVRRRKTKQLIVYAFVYAAAAVLSVLQLFRIRIWDPNGAIAAFIRWFVPV